MLLEWTEPKRSQSGLRAATIVRLAGLTLSTRATDSSRTILSLRLSARAIRSRMPRSGCLHATASTIGMACGKPRSLPLDGMNTSARRHCLTVCALAERGSSRVR